MKNYNLWLIKIDRIAAWILLVSIFLYFISGYGMTKGIIDRESATFLHQDILPFIVILAFTIHAFSGVRMAFMRFRIWNQMTKIGLSLIFIFSLLSLLYFELFFQPKISENIKINTTENQQQVGLEVSETNKLFTISDLSKHDGLNGNPAYVAVDGIVYDLSNVFKNGVHFGHTAGQDLTNDFFIKHMKSQITKYPVVGFLQ
jgi:predicted heme/steroid binding protein/succinate dehydrogenase/fumarate reductase cytochrome b subunit